MKTLLSLLLLFFTTTSNAGSGVLDSLGLNKKFATPPRADEAFQFFATPKDEQNILVRWSIADGNYLYKDKIRFELVNNTDIKLLTVSLPTGENKRDEIFGLSEVYYHDIKLILPLNRMGNNSKVTLKAHYQGCSETFNICYPPTEKEITLNLPNYVAKNVDANIESVATIARPEQDKIAESLAQDNLGKILLTFFGLGILLAFTPCVFPMIPILSSIIVGAGESITTYRAFILSLTYVLAISVTYTAAGILTGLLGKNLQAVFQNPWIISSFSILFVILAMSMFGLFELRMPYFLKHHLHKIHHRQQGGTVIGVILMGLISGVIVSPCLAPPLAGALIFIGQHGDPILGGSALFALSLGMGLPLIAIGTSEGSLLPRAGNWMNVIKSVFGVLMLGLAIWMMERIIPGWMILLLWGALLIVSAIYLGALNSLSIDATGWSKFWKAFGLILLIYGALLIIGGASGHHNVWQPLYRVTTAENDLSSKSSELIFYRIDSLAELEQHLAQTTQPVMLDFYADWCTDCKKMAVTTFADPRIKSATTNWQLLQVDVTDNLHEHQVLANYFGVFGPPTLLFFDRSGQEYKQFRLVGAISATALFKHIQRLPSKAAQ